MKKFLTILLLTLIVRSGMAQFLQKPKQVHKHFTYYEDGWPNEMHFWGRFTYNSFGQLTKYEETKDLGQFGNSYFVWKYWYDNNHRLFKSMYNGYDGGGIYGTDSTFYVYDGELLDHTKKLYIDKWGGWYYTDSTAYSYDDNKALVRTESFGTKNLYSWSTTPRTVTEYFRTEEGMEVDIFHYQSGKISDCNMTHYDSENRILDYLYESYRDDGTLNQRERKNYDYLDGLCRTMTHQKWNFTDSCWVNKACEVYQYNDMGVKIEAVSMNWVDNEWQNTTQTLWAFDEEGLCQNIIHKNWDEEEFVNNEKVNYMYDEKGFCIGLSFEKWSEEEWIESFGGGSELIFLDESLKQENNLIQSGRFSFTDVTVSWQTIYLEFQHGSEWYYEMQNDGGNVTYQHLSYTTDTTINDNDRVKVIVRTNHIYDKEQHQGETHEYLFEDRGKVYWWNKTLEEFTTLYDFTAEEGDEWEIKVGTESLVMHVDSVGVFDYQGHQHKVLHVSDAGGMFGGDIVIGLGHMASFFPEKLMSRGEGFTVEGLRCFWVEDALVYDNGDEDCDAVYLSIHEVEENNNEKFSVYPNPTDGLIHVETLCAPSSQEATTYRITNPMGQVLMRGTITNPTVDVSALPAGMYFITIGNQIVKLMKQ